MSSSRHAKTRFRELFEAWAGIEPAHIGFANRCVTTSPPGQIVLTILARDE